MSVPELNTAIYTALAGTVTAAGSAVYFLQAPENEALPYIVFDYTSDIDENLDANRTKNDVVFIRGYAETPGQAGTIDTQIDAVLHNQTLTVTGYTNFWLARESAYSLAETDEAGRRTYMAGAEYRVRLDKN